MWHELTDTKLVENQSELIIKAEVHVLDNGSGTCDW